MSLTKRNVLSDVMNEVGGTTFPGKSEKYFLLRFGPFD